MERRLIESTSRYDSAKKSTSRNKEEYESRDGFGRKYQEKYESAVPRRVRMAEEEDEDLVYKQATTTKKEPCRVQERADPRVKKSQVEPSRTMGSHGTDPRVKRAK